MAYPDDQPSPPPLYIPRQKTSPTLHTPQQTSPPPLHIPPRPSSNMASKRQGSPNPSTSSPSINPTPVRSTTASPNNMPPRNQTRVPGKPPLPPSSKPPSNSRGRASTPAKGVAHAMSRGFSSKDAPGKEGGDKESKRQGEGSSKGKGTAARTAENGNSDVERVQFEAKLGKVCRRLESELMAMEQDIGKREEEYIAKTWSHGNVMRGWDGFVRRVERERGGTGSGTATGAPKYRKNRPGDRIFSLSSSTSQFRKDNPDALILKKGIEKKKKKKR